MRTIKSYRYVLLGFAVFGLALAALAVTGEASRRGVTTSDSPSTSSQSSSSSQAGNSSDRVPGLITTPILPAAAGSSDPTVRGEEWLDSFPQEQRAPASDPDAIIQMLHGEIGRLFPEDEERIIVNPDGSEVTEKPPFQAQSLIAGDPVFVESRNDGDEDYDHVIVAFRDNVTDDVPLIITCLWRDGMVVPASYSVYPPDNRPPTYPFLSVEEAEDLTGASGPTSVFYSSPVSPTPVLFVYEFIDEGHALYVSQDGAVWSSLEEMNGPFE
jgi:hypothetical protein